MSVSNAKRSAWAKKFGRLTAAEKKTQEDTLVAVYEATQDGVTQADIAYMIGGIAPSGIAAKAVKGQKILEGRKKA